MTNKMNKKAYAAPIIDYFATVVIILIIVIFMMLLKLHHNEIEVTINENIGANDGHLFLSSYLQKNVEFETNITIAELLDRINIEDPPSYYMILMPATLEFLQELQDTTGCPAQINIRIDDYSMDTIKLSNAKAKKPCTTQKRSFKSTQLLPSRTGKHILVEIEGGVK